MALLDHAWGFVGYLLPFLFVITLVVFFHELGHYAVGRLCGVKVDAFSIGFGPEIWAYTRKNGERWRIAWLPLGGYVKFHGDPNGASAGMSDDARDMPEAERKVTFFGQTVGKRAAIVAAGPGASFLLGALIFAASFYFEGRTVLAPVIEKLRAGEAGEAAGLQSGDVVVSIDGQTIIHWGEMQRIVQTSPDKPLVFVVQRGTRDVTVEVTPRRREVQTAFGAHRVGLIGAEPSNRPENLIRQEFGLVESLGKGAYETWFVVERTVAYLVGLVAGRESPDQITGPLRIAEISGAVAKVSFTSLVYLAGIISVSIGLMNLFPIPMLDGGHLLYYAVEALKGRPLSEKNQELGFRLGLGVVMALMIFATINDVLHVGPKLLKLFG
jgi:regulator of sigma E protease